MTTAIATRTASHSASPTSDTLELAADTWLLRDVMRSESLAFDNNSMVIAGSQPVIVDIGREENRGWEAEVFSLVEPAAVRWVFVSRLVRGWVERLSALADSCPNATFVCNGRMAERVIRQHVMPRNRIRVVAAGEEMSIGDRSLRFVQLPVSYSCDTLGLLDQSTGVLWASDAFGSALLEPVDNVRELCPQEWREGFQTFNRRLAPWTTSVAEPVLAAAIRHLGEETIRVIAAAHSPVIDGCNVGSAIDMLYDLSTASLACFSGRREVDSFIASQYRRSANKERAPGAAHCLRVRA